MRTPQIPVNNASLRAKQSIIFFFLIALSGCAAKGQQTQQTQTVSTVEKVLTAISGTEVDEKKLRELNREMKNDPQAKSAVETIANAVSGQGQVIKYCLVDGERYGPKFEECPVHKVLLEILSE